MNSGITTHHPLVTFKSDVHKGLSSKNKYLDSKYFYDETGSRLFRQITQLPEYYLTASELNILEDQKESIASYINANRDHFDLLELGAGDGKKTQVLLRYLLDQFGNSFNYIPIDISGESNAHLYRRMKEKFPQLSIRPINDDYFNSFRELERNHRRKVILFLGSNVGNYTMEEAVDFYREINYHIHEGDMILTGFDLIKDPHTILSAYNDPTGITRDFNLNLLHRINRELGGNFDTGHFIHYPVYDPGSGAARSYLVSDRKQEVSISALENTYTFDRWELIYMEISQKYDMAMIEALASDSGYSVIQNFTDDKNYFTCSLWKKVST